MEENKENKILPFATPTNAQRIIKVIGVGGGGGNAVQNMYREGIHNVTFAVCNTDSQALAASDVPAKVQLGLNITEGLGAGNDPTVAEEAAKESENELRSLLEDGTKMVFITAGMGGGTGTGATPTVARIAKEMGLLTVAIVTLPFKFEMQNKIHQALKGVAEVAKYVDALLVINNQRLLKIYPRLNIKEGFKKVDEVLTTATKSIAEIITARGKINLDFRDVKKVLKDGGVAIMSYGIQSGDQRVAKAFKTALHSPLLNDNDIYKSKKLLFNIYYNPNTSVLVEEMEEVENFMKQFTDVDIEVIWGLSEDYSLEEGCVKVTVLATGFGMRNIPGMEPIVEKISDEEQKKRDEEKRKEEEMIGRIEMMKDIYYKPDYHVYIFEGDELDNEEFINALDNSPTHSRTIRQHEMLKSMASGIAAENAKEEPTAANVAEAEGDNENGNAAPTEDNAAEGTPDVYEQF